MKTLIYFLLWCVICSLWQVARLVDDGSPVEVQLSDLEVRLKVLVQGKAVAAIQEWADA